MKLGIIIPTFNRPKYLEQCLSTIEASEIPEGTLFIIVDDNSTDEETLNLIVNFKPKGADVIVHYNETNLSVSGSLKFGYNKCFSYGCDVVMNLDSDSIVRPDFISRLMDLHSQFPTQIVSGFHSINKNRNGTDRHPIIQKGSNWATKKTVGGINMLMNEATFRRFMEPALDKVLSSKQHNWDFLCCTYAHEAGLPVVVGIPSVVDHIGWDSSMKHTEEPDVACDFVQVHNKPLSLPTVTLIAVEGVDLAKIKIPLEASTKFIEYGAVKLLSPLQAADMNIIPILPMESKGEYSKFIMKELDSYVDTEFALLCQHDGFVVNYKSWSDDFLNYDYVGAAWNWYGDSLNVGNGGFSLRSKKLIHICATDEVLTELHPEDHAIGRTYRRYLEKHHGIKFAPKEVADRFSIEAFKVDSPGNKYNGSFGFHGKSVDFRGADLVYNPANLPKQHSNGGVTRPRLRRQRVTGSGRR